MGIDEEIASLEEEIRKTPYNKATAHHIGKLKAKLARLREAKEKRAGGGGGGKGYAVKKSGHATVALVGLPSVGKSSLLNALTDAESRVAPYEFTTLTCIPGMMKHEGAEIQILDLPGLIPRASVGKGRGKEVLSVVRSSDLVLLVAEAQEPQRSFVVTEELERAGIRLGKTPPDIRIVREKSRGGITASFTVPQTRGLDEEIVRDVVREYGLVNADVVIRTDSTVDELIDALAGNRVYLPILVALNKVDVAPADVLEESIRTFRKRGWRSIPISAEKGTNLDLLKDAIVEELQLIRVYLRPQGGEPDLKEPLVLRRGSTVAEVCNRLHREFRERFRYALVWGPSAKFPGQSVGENHVLHDGDILTLVLRRS